MDPALYEQFTKLKKSGLKQEATAVLEAFIASFRTMDEKRQWVPGFLEQGDYGLRIRHELYEAVVFPVLLEGYVRRDVWSLCWLAKTIQNVYADRGLFAQIDYKGEWGLLREAYDLSPTEEIKQSLLSTMLNWFGYSQHEWPSGILFGADGASLSECEKILRDVAFARTLDSGANTDYLNEFESKVHAYQRRLQSRQSVNPEAQNDAVDTDKVAFEE
jgi:hypothetical protein